jgi:ribosome-associated heat shock protein Hsp15
MRNLSSRASGPATTAVTEVRLDVWLDVACLFKTRSEAQRACKGGKVVLNGAPAKPHREVRVGDELEITRPLGRKHLITVTGLADKHLPKADARGLYDDRTPQPTAEEVEMRRLERLFRATSAPRNRPDRRGRQDLRRLRGKD